MATEKFANDLGTGTTLSTALTDTTGTSVVVASTSGMPTTPQFRIRIGTELMLVTAVSGTTLTVTRGAEGSTAATHASGDAVYHVLTAASVQAPSLVYAAYPASPGYTVPILSNFTLVNGTGATTTQLANSVTLLSPGATSYNLRLLTYSIPASPYTLTALFQINATLQNYTYCGLCWYDGTKVVTAGIKYDFSKLYLSVDKWATVTGALSNYTSPQVVSPHFWLQISNTDNTNQVFKVSLDGLNFTQIHTVAKGDYLTATQVGVVWMAANTTTPAPNSFSASWLSFTQT